MYLLVGLEISLQVLALVVIDHFLVKLAKGCQLFVVQTIAGGFAGQPFQGRHDIVGVFHVA